MHPRNKHQKAYDFDALQRVYPALTNFVKTNPRGQTTIDFSQSEAVKALNAGLLILHYDLKFWDIPQGYLCPPVPGRADYIHALADLLNKHIDKARNDGKSLKGIDIGTGANLIYPIIGSHEYNWQFVATDIDKTAVLNAKNIVKSNSRLNRKVKVRHQSNQAHIFKSLVLENEQFDFCMCNPPFHKSAKEAQAGSKRKVENLKHNKTKRSGNFQKNTSKSASTATLNFAGQHNELWCDGGELAFIKRMIKESVEYQDQVIWFTSLVSKKENLASIANTLDSIKVKQFEIIKMSQGNKQSRFVAWTYSMK